MGGCGGGGGGGDLQYFKNFLIYQENYEHFSQE